MQSEQMKIVKDGDTIRVMPEMKQMKDDFNQFTREADEVVAKLKRAELEKAVQKQADVMKFLTEMLNGSSEKRKVGTHPRAPNRELGATCKDERDSHGVLHL